MPFTKEFEIPSDEELAVENVNISLSGLRAGAIHLGQFCEKENNEFVLCKSELQDPRKCINEGKEVTKCSYKFFCLVKKHCSKEFEQYAKCLYKSSSDMEYKYCRKTQAIFDKCLYDKAGLSRPKFGTAAEVHIHHTDRPKPKEEITYFPNTPDKLPENIKHEDPKYGARHRY